MRKNPLLYSDHSDFEDSDVELHEEPKQKRSLLFYLIVLANTLLVVFVLGIIWFLFLKSPDFQLKELTQKYFGSESPAVVSPQPVDSKVMTNISSRSDASANDATNLTQQQQDEIQQMRLKQMREQEELAAERQRLEKMRAEVEAEKLAAEAAKKALAAETAAKTDNTKQPGTNDSAATQVTEAASDQTLNGEAGVTQNESILIKTSITSEAAPNASLNNETANSSESIEAPTEEPAVVPNAANELPVPEGNTVDTQVDQIMETLKQQQQEKEKENAEKRQNDSTTSLKSIPLSVPTKLITDSSIEPDHKLIEQQLEALIDSEALNASGHNG